MKPPPSPLAEFDAIYVINLPFRTDRRREIAEQLSRVGLSFDSPQVHLFEAIRPDDAGGFENIGARGCFMSHLGALKSAIGRRNVLILEDDLDFVDSMQAPVLPDGWGIFYGGGRHELRATGALTSAPPEHLVYCAHFFAVNGPYIPRLVTHLEAILRRPKGDPLGGPMHVDGAYSHFRAHYPDIWSLVATPDIGFQRSSRTDIHPLQWFDRLLGVRELAQLARRVLRLIRAKAAQRPH